MFRLLFTFVSMLSLLLMISVYALYVRSFWVGDNVTITLPGTAGDETTSTLSAASRRGGLAATYVQSPSTEPGETAKPGDGSDSSQWSVAWNEVEDPVYPDVSVGSATEWWQRAGFDWMDSETSDIPLPFDVRYRGVVAPHWFVSIVLAFLPAIWFLTRSKKARRARMGLCVRCGYDLCESTHHCPECGQPFDHRK